MTTINQILSERKPEVNRLLRKFHVVGPPTLDTIQKAHERHGERFMMKLLDIVVPETNSFTGLIQPKEAQLTSVLDTKTLATSPAVVAAMEEITAENQQPGKVWSFWENLLNGVTKTGETIADFKQNLGAPVVKETAYSEEEAAAQAGKSKVMYFAAGGIVLFVILILIIYRR